MLFFEALIQFLFIWDLRRSCNLYVWIRPRINYL